MHKPLEVLDDHGLKISGVQSSEGSNSAIPPIEYHQHNGSKGYTSPVIKRPAEVSSIPERKRVFYGNEKEKSTIPQGHVHARWLIESYLCAKVLGPGGKRIRNMKDTSKDAVTSAWITPKVPNIKFRVFNCIGTPKGVAKIAALFVKALHEENNTQAQTEPKFYDFKLLIPVIFVDEMAGTGNENLLDIEAHTNAKISVDMSTFARTDEKCIHVNGVRDAIQASLDFIFNRLVKIYGAAKFDPQTSSLILYARTPRTNPSKQSDLYTPNSRNKPQDLNYNDKVEQKPLQVLSGSVSGVVSSSKGTLSEPLTLNSKPFDFILPKNQDINSSQSNILTAFDIAKDSGRSRLRQMLQIPCSSSSKGELEFLIENIRRVTDCTVEAFPVDKSELDHDDHLLEDDEEVSLVIEGAPSENLLGIFLIYRFLHKTNSKSMT